MSDRALHELHAETALVIESRLEPLLKRMVIEPDSWRTTVIFRRTGEGHERQWVCCTNDQVEELVRMLSQEDRSELKP